MEKGVQTREESPKEAQVGGGGGSSGNEEQVAAAAPLPSTETEITEGVQQEIEQIKASSRLGLEDQLRRDRRAMTITDLDTGDEYVIGENDPDFEWDTFEIRVTVPLSEKKAGAAGAGAGSGAGTAAPLPPKSPSPRGWWGNVWSLWGLLGPPPKRTPAHAHPSLSSQQYTASALSSSSSSSSRAPFTKLSAFKFRKELGRGAFGRVLLAEARVDGALYALKIISKKNMRSSDKRQAKVRGEERRGEERRGGLCSQWLWFLLQVPD